MATILKKNKCVEYGIGDDGMLFLYEYGGGFVMADIPENRRFMEGEFDKWSKTTYCKICLYKYECREAKVWKPCTNVSSVCLRKK